VVARFHCLVTRPVSLTAAGPGRQQNFRIFRQAPELLGRGLLLGKAPWAHKKTLVAGPGWARNLRGADHGSVSEVSVSAASVF
jgi:hypothetical protein